MNPVWAGFSEKQGAQDDANQGEQGSDADAHIPVHGQRNGRIGY
jgi:hypothetical protein